MDWISLTSLIISLPLIGYFFGIESAFAGGEKLAIELQKKQGKISGKTWSRFNEKPSTFMTTLLTGLNVFIIAYGLLAGKMLLPLWTWIELHLPSSAADYVKFIKLLVETFFSSALLILVAFISRALFTVSGDKLLRSDFIAYLFAFFHAFFSTIGAGLMSASIWILKYILNVKIPLKKETLTVLDMNQLSRHRKHADEEENMGLNKELFENALTIGEVKLRECLVPRKEIEAISLGADIQTVRQKFIETQLTRLLVYEQSIDNVCGYVHQLDLLGAPESIKHILRPIPMVPLSMNATDLMNKFSKDRKSIACVIDEFGGTAGIVTMEDLLEELFGDIKDEYDVAEEFVEKQISNNEFIFSGRLEMDHISAKYELEFPEINDAETLSGYIIGINESIPAEKDRIIFDKYEFQILHVTDTRIETVKLKLLK